MTLSRKVKNLLLLLTLSFVVLCFYNYQYNKDYRISFKEKYSVDGAPNLDKSIKLGGFSGLFYDKTDNQGNVYLWAITDRGPNSNKFKKNTKTFRVFPIQKFKPKIVYLKLTTGKKVEIINVSDVSELSGIPISAKRDSTPVTKNHNNLPFDINGADTEGLVKDKVGNFWIVDEYYPSIIKLDKDLKILKRFAPKDSKVFNKSITYNLPSIFNKIKKNNGFESIDYDNKERIYIFIQSNLKKGLNIKVLVFNIKSENVEKVYDYHPDKKSIVSDIVFIKNGLFLSLEKTDENHIISKIIIPDQQESGNIYGKKIISLQKDNSFITSEFKMEGIAYDGENKIFIINDNDFGIDDKNTKESFLLEYKLEGCSLIFPKGLIASLSYWIKKILK